MSLILAACATERPIPPPAPAAPTPSIAPGPAPGQWQLVIEVEELPAGRKPAPQTMTLCSTAADKKQWQDMVGGKTAAGCAITNYLGVGPIISYTMQCGSGVEGSTLITVVDDDHYRGESRLAYRNAGSAGNAGQSSEIRSRVVATRLAPECKR